MLDSEQQPTHRAKHPAVAFHRAVNEGSKRCGGLRYISTHTTAEMHAALERMGFEIVAKADHPDVR